MTSPVPPDRPGGPPLADILLAGAAMLWMAEALVRLPHQWLLTSLVYAAFSLRFLFRLPDLVALLAARPALLPFPALCLLSVLWSEVPTHTFVAAIQLCFTLLAGLHIGQVFGLRGLAWLIAGSIGATLLLSVLNLAALFPPAWSWEHGFLGIYTNKNALGQRAMLLALTLVFLAATTRGSYRALVLAMLALAVAMLALSLSVTAILFTAAAAGTLALRVASRGRPYLTAALGVTAATVVALTATLTVLLSLDPLTLLVEAFGKTGTLTGRTDLWRVALDEIAARPLLGHAYMGYWEAPSLAQKTRMLADSYGATVASFHDFALEILVMLGPLGLAAMALFLAEPLRRLRALPPGLIRMWALTTLAALIGLSLLGSSLYRPHEITLLLVAALAAAAPAPRAVFAPGAARNTATTAPPAPA